MRNVGPLDWAIITFCLIVAFGSALIFVDIGHGLAFLAAIVSPWVALIQWVSPIEETWTFRLQL